MNNTDTKIKEAVSRFQEEFSDCTFNRNGAFMGGELMQFLESELSQITKESEKKNHILFNDINRAIGRMRGLGYPDKYLEIKYNLKQSKERKV